MDIKKQGQRGDGKPLYDKYIVNFINPYDNSIMYSKKYKKYKDITNELNIHKDVIYRMINNIFDYSRGKYRYIKITKIES